MTRILVAEDSATQAEILRTVLHTAGFQTHVAADGESALRCFGEETFDIVITDIVMPGMTGYELCRAIKQGARNDTPVILLSALNDPMDIIRGLECAADSFITKPYQAERLIARIRSILENRKVRAAHTHENGVKIFFLGEEFLISAEKEQILDMLISTFEDSVRANIGLQKTQADLSAAKLILEKYARELEMRVTERTAELEKKALELNFALEKSHKSEAQFRSLVSNLALPMLVCDTAALRILHVNHAAIREYGYGQQEFLTIGIQDLLVDQLQPETAEKLLADVGRAIHRRHRKKSGEIMDVELTSTGLDFEGRSAILIVASDVTERLRAEAQLRHSERLDAVGSLTGGIAHDFNNLLMVIKASAEDLCEGLPASVLKQSAELALEAANRGADLIQHLMAFARKQDLSPASVDVNVLIYNVIRLIRRTLPTNINIRFEAGGGLPAILMDPSRLENAILNLAVNARDAMPEGGELIVETAVTRLDEEYANLNPDVRPDSYVMIALSDTGSGMSQDVIDHAFDPFYTTKGVGKGTGLGLSMVYGLVKQVGGHAKIHSVVGKGSTVKLYLPLPRGDVQATKFEVTEKAPVPGNRGVVLLVEDDDLVRKSLSTKLQRLGYGVRAVASAKEAIHTLEQEAHFQVMISDVMMPGSMNGAELASEVLQRWPHVGVLLNSGYTETSIGGKVKIPEGIRVLSKPYSNADLSNALQAAKRSAL